MKTRKFISFIKRIKMHSIIGVLIALALVAGTTIAIAASDQQIEKTNPLATGGKTESENLALESSNEPAIVEREELIRYTLDELSAIEDVKYNIYYNMLNSIDFYDAATGVIETTFGVSGEVATVEYMTDIPAEKSYQHIRSETADVEYAYTDDVMYMRDNNNGMCNAAISVSQLEFSPRVSELDVDVCIAHGEKVVFYTGEKAIYDRIVENEDGTKGYYYRTDLTNTPIAEQSIFPQALAMAILSDTTSWNIDAVEEYLERPVVVISGKISDEDYSEKIQAETFTMKVDLTTGILLEFTAFDANGSISQYIKTLEMAVYRNGINEKIDKEIMSEALKIKEGA